MPANTRRGKGWTGTVIEHALGANAGSRPEPDFRLISIELKTIPVGPDRRPLESTYVCTVPLAGDAAPDWRDSNARRKLSKREPALAEVTVMRLDKKQPDHLAMMKALGRTNTPVLVLFAGGTRWRGHQGRDVGKTS